MCFDLHISNLKKLLRTFLFLTTLSALPVSPLFAFSPLCSLSLSPPHHDTKHDDLQVALILIGLLGFVTLVRDYNKPGTPCRSENDSAWDYQHADKESCAQIPAASAQVKRSRAEVGGWNKQQRTQM